MIKNKSDLKYYMQQDKKQLAIPSERKHPRPFVDLIWKYEILLRKSEYFHNINKSFFSSIMAKYYIFRLIRMGQKLGFTIGINVFGPGLSIAHYGCIVVSGGAKIGSNCRIHEGVTIGATNGESEAAVIGDNCFIGSGAKIIGKVELANNVAIGAGAVVVKSFKENNVSLAGVPAKIISNNGSSANMVH